MVNGVFRICYGLLLGNCGYQTDRKIYDQSENRSSLAILALSARCASDKIINSLREKQYLFFQLDRILLMQGFGNGTSTK